MLPAIICLLKSRERYLCIYFESYACLVLSKVAKLPQVVQQQTPVASIQQVASASQQVEYTETCRVLGGKCVSETEY